MSSEVEEKPKKGYPSNLSKKKYHEIASAYKQMFSEEDAAKAMQVICNVLNFDPTKGTYTPEKGKRIMERRKRIQEETGISTYVLCGGKASYHRNKNKDT